MSNPNQPSQPYQIDQRYSQLDVITRLAAEAIALGDRDPSKPIPSGDLSTLPSALREFVLKSRPKALQEQADRDKPPPEAPQ